MGNRTGLTTYQKEGRFFMKKQKTVSWIVAIVVVLALVIAGTKLYELMFGGAVKVQTADIISAIAQMKVQLIIGAVILIAGIVIFIIGCRKKEEGTKASDTADDQLSDDDYYVVQKGETLAGISQKLYGDTSHVKAICKMNGLSDGNLIYIGQKLLLP